MECLLSNRLTVQEGEKVKTIELTTLRLLTTDEEHTSIVSPFSSDERRADALLSSVKRTAVNHELVARLS
jgi:hypothetical protein